MGCAAGSHGLPPPKACVTQVHAVTWELKSFLSAENEFQLSHTPGSLSLRLSASPRFPPSQPGPQEALGRTQLWAWILCSP